MRENRMSGGNTRLGSATTHSIVGRLVLSLCWGQGWAARNRRLHYEKGLSSYDAALFLFLG